MTAPKGRRTGPGPFYGVVLILVGCLFLLDELELIRFGRVIGTWWPMLLITLGVSKILWERRIGAGGWLVFVGSWMQAVELSLFGMTYGNSWPVFLIAAGGIMIAESLLGFVSGEQGETRKEEQP